jgi:glycerol kinase
LDHAFDSQAIGADYLAGLRAGLLPTTEIFSNKWKRDKRFSPEMGANTRVKIITGWKEALRTLLS